MGSGYIIILVPFSLTPATTCARLTDWVLLAIMLPFISIDPHFYSTGNFAEQRIENLSIL